MKFVVTIPGFKSIHRRFSEHLSEVSTSLRCPGSSGQPLVNSGKSQKRIKIIHLYKGPFSHKHQEIEVWRFCIASFFFIFVMCIQILGEKS